MQWSVLCIQESIQCRRRAAFQHYAERIHRNIRTLGTCIVSQRFEERKDINTKRQIPGRWKAAYIAPEGTPLLSMVCL